jgi:hypothetical protein
MGVSTLLEAFMSQNAGPVPVRLEIRAGEIAVRGTRLDWIHKTLSDGFTEIEEVATEECGNVSLADLRGRPAVAVPTLIDAQLDASRSSNEMPWLRATVREDALTALLEENGSPPPRAEEVAQTYRVSVRTLYQWPARYRDTALTAAVLPHARGIRSGTRRLDAERELLVNKIIEQQYLSRSRPSVDEIVRILNQRCVERQVQSE